jgi:hypothetical protein
MQNGEMSAGTIPSLTSLNEKKAPSAATTTSQAVIRPTPPPIAGPATRAITGLGKS